MKRLALVFGLVLAWSAAAQQPRIVGFYPAGTVTWTNAETNVYCGVEWTMDLGYTWLPLLSTAWDVFATSSVQSASFDLDIFANIDWISDDLNGRMNSHFFRMRTFPSGGNRASVTNWVRLVNAAGDVLTNVVFGRKEGETYTTNATFEALGTGNETPFVPIEEQFGPLDMIGYPSELEPFPYWEGWFVSYDQLDTNHMFGTPIFWVGPPWKPVSVTVSNTGATISFDWLSDLTLGKSY